MIETYAIYASPDDYPGQYVLRRYVLAAPDIEPMAVSPDLSAVRARVPRGLVRFLPSPEDVPALLETWL